MSKADAAHVREALERRLARDRTYRKLTREIEKAQSALARTVKPEVWALYLVLEERINARHSEIVDAAIEIAFRRHARSRK